MTFDFDKITESKRAMRERLAALPISEKLQLLEAMRRREIAIRQALRKAPNAAKAQLIELTRSGEHSR